MSTSAAYSHFDLRPLTPHLGGEVVGVDLSRTLTEDVLAELHQAWLDWSVLVFEDQRLDRAAHRAFGRAFGELHVHPGKRHLDVQGDADIFVVETNEKTHFPTGGAWHTDASCEVIPPMASMLYLKETPPSGGDTLFADMYLAYELLSPPLQAFLATLTACHDGRKDLQQYGVTLKPGQDYPRADHPMVVTHPETGRKLLYVNESFTARINGITRGESDALLGLLFDLIATTPRLHCRVGGKPGTLMFWDNRCTQHHAVWDYAPARRSGERVSVLDTRPPGN